MKASTLSRRINKVNLEQLAKELIQNFESRNAAAIANLCDESVSFENVAENKVINGRATLLQVLSEFFKNVSKVNWEIHQVIASHDRIAIERTSHITFNNNKISIRAVAILIIADGKITRFSDYFDAETFKKQNKNQAW